MASRHARHIVRAIQGIDREALEQPIGHHRLGPTPMLLGRLEHETHGTVEVTLAAQQVCGTQHHRHVPVVATGVHLAVVAGRMRPLMRLFGDVQGIHVGTQADHAWAVTDSEAGNQAGATDATVHLQAKAGEDAGDLFGGVELFKAGFRVPVKRVPPVLEAQFECRVVAHA
ncbi:hypothetical protein D3C80_789390 [compost metagenome]